MAGDDPLALDRETMRQLGYRTVDLLVDWLERETPPLQRAAPAENTEQQVAGIDLRLPAGRQLEHVVGSAVGQCAHRNNIARTRRSAITFQKSGRW